jgi:hypothetical protein
MSLECGTFYYRKKPAPRVNLGRDLEAALTWYARQAVPGKRLRYDRRCDRSLSPRGAAR